MVARRMSLIVATFAVAADERAVAAGGRDEGCGIGRGT